MRAWLLRWELHVFVYHMLQGSRLIGKRACSQECSVLVSAFVSYVRRPKALQLNIVVDRYRSETYSTNWFKKGKLTKIR